MLKEYFLAALTIAIVFVMFVALLGAFCGLIWCIVKLGKVLSVLCIKEVRQTMCRCGYHRVIHYDGNHYVCKRCGEHFFWEENKFHDCDDIEYKHVKEVQF